MIKRIAIFAVGCLTLPLLTQAQDSTYNIIGDWQGELDAARYEPIPVILHIEPAAEQTGSFTGTVDFPSQYRTGLPINNIRINGNNISIMLNEVQAEFYGELILDSDQQKVLAMQGDWSQAGEYVPMEITRLNTEETAQ